MNPLDMSETTNLPSLDQNLRSGQWWAFELLWFKNGLKSNFGSIFMRKLQAKKCLKSQFLDIQLKTQCNKSLHVKYRDNWNKIEEMGRILSIGV